MQFFFFKQKTAYEMRISDWSSDVCSSDLCTNWRWNTRNAIRSGAIDIIVAAEITEMSTPLSGAPKIESPTVKGLVSGELVTMSGQRKLFQWVETDTKA